MDADIGGTKPKQMFIALLHPIVNNFIIVIVETIFHARFRIAIDKGMVMGVEEADVCTDLHTEVASGVQGPDIASAKTCAYTFALPAPRLAEGDAVPGALGIQTHIGTREIATAFEIATRLELQITYLEELPFTPVTMVREGEAYIVGVMALLGVIFRLEIDAIGKAKVWNHQNVVDQICPEGDHVATGVTSGQRITDSAV